MAFEGEFRWVGREKTVILIGHVLGDSASADMYKGASFGKGGEGLGGKLKRENHPPTERNGNKQEEKR